MFKARKRLFTGLLLAGLLLTSCGSKADETTVPVASPDAPGTDVTVQSFIGKISSINGNEITLYKAGSGVQESAVAVPETSAGNNSAEAAGSEAGQASGSETTGGQNPGAKETGDTAGNAPDSAPQFTAETVTITVDDNTDFVQLTGASKSADQKSANVKDTLADLKAGDVIKVTLNPDSLTAAIIEVQAALATGGGKVVTEPSPVASPSPPPSASADGKALPSAGVDSKPQQSPGAAPGGKDGQAPTGGKGGTPPSGAPGVAPGGRPGAGAKPAASAGASAKPAASAGDSAKPAASAGDSAKPAASAGASAKPAASAGASAKPAASAGASAKPAASAGASAKPAASAGGSAKPAALSFGKIKSISGNAITLYTAEAPAAPPQNGAATAGAAEGAAPPGKSSAPAGAAGGEQPTNLPQGGGQMSFSETTKVITVTSSTKLLSVTFDNGTRSEATLALSALKAGDIIQYTLKAGTSEAESITLSSGGPGGGQ
ncbi:hypothetical protein [Paenibacillus sp. HW567]|uniref:hypothetical protein n=1 Tax=Paenibacillus sp. HW567 TaxID=1034769 RepID=UPI0003806FF8|nr:hypothetical protein [Paenibacillus sp. HW567]